VFSAETLRSLRVEGHLLDVATHSSSSRLLSKAAANELDVRELVHDAPDEILKRRDPANGMIIRRMSTSRDDNDFDCLKILYSRHLVLVGSIVLPFLFSGFHKLSHE